MSGRIPQSVIEQIRAANDITEVIGSYIPLKQAGGNSLALCPFHKENTPSFTVNPQRQIYHCFGCHAHGDVFKFLQEYEHLEFIEAVKRLAERGGIPLEFEENPQAERSRRKKDLFLHIHSELAKRWHEVLMNEEAGKPARNYLKTRAITRRGAELFQLGYAPQSWEDTINWARTEKFDLQVMQEAGLVAKKDSKCYGRFRGRLMFPIHDEQGRVIGFSGRVLETSAKAAKYVNSPETILFHKSKVFYGMDKARREILSKKSALICEGQIDTMACHLAGLNNVVAPQGTALTADHARILKRYTSEVILCFDSDTAGQAAAVRSFEALLESELAVRVMAVPAPHDPDSYIAENGIGAFRQLMESAPAFFDFYLAHLVGDHDVNTERGRREIIQAMGLMVRKAKDSVLLDDSVQKTAFAIGASAEAVRAEFQRIKVPVNKLSQISEPTKDVAELQIDRPSQRDWAADCLDSRWIVHAQVRSILDRAAQTGDSPEVLIGDMDVSCTSLLSEVLADSNEIPSPARQLKDLVTLMRDCYLDRKLSELTRLMASQPNLPEKELMLILDEQRELQEQKQESLPDVPTSVVT